MVESFAEANPVVETLTEMDFAVTVALERPLTAPSAPFRSTSRPSPPLRPVARDVAVVSEEATAAPALNPLKTAIEIATETVLVCAVVVASVVRAPVLTIRSLPCPPSIPRASERAVLDAFAKEAPRATPSSDRVPVTATLVRVLFAVAVTVAVPSLRSTSSPAPPSSPTASALVLFWPSTAETPAARPACVPSRFTPTLAALTSDVAPTIRVPELTRRSAPSPPLSPSATDVAVVSPLASAPPAATPDTATPAMTDTEALAMSESAVAVTVPWLTIRSSPLPPSMPTAAELAVTDRSAAASPATSPVSAPPRWTLTLAPAMSEVDVAVILFVLRRMSSPSPPRIPVASEMAFVVPSERATPAATPVMVPSAETPTWALLASA